MTRNGKYPYGYRSSLASVGDANANRMERDLTISFLRSKQMLAVYRGVPYNTDRKLTEEADYVKVTETYRGIQYTKTVKVEASK